jgi:glycosyltransferase involved in cell wall biosynthesis
LKVALLSPFGYPIVEPFAGGTEAFIFRLATGLLRRGVEVVCYACEGSCIPGVEIRTCGVSREALVSSQLPGMMSVAERAALRTSEDAAMRAAINDACSDPSIDILHNNSFSSIPLYFSSHAHIPIIHTLHLPPIVPAMVDAIRLCHKNGCLLHLVAGSQAQAQLWQVYHPVLQVIYYRFDMEALPPCSTTHDGTLAFIGRIDPCKGVEDAIAVAVALGKRLDIYGGVQGPRVTYFQTRVQPLLQMHTNVVYHGLVSQAILLQELRRAQALLFPIKWNEPFGYVTIEAMSVGTPVLMYDRGAARELIVEGVNGFIVAPDNPQEMAAAVERTELVDRARCATYAREKFNIAISVEQYLELFNVLCKSA